MIIRVESVLCYLWLYFYFHWLSHHSVLKKATARPVCCRDKRSPLVEWARYLLNSALCLLVAVPHTVTNPEVTFPNLCINRSQNDLKQLLDLFSLCSAQHDYRCLFRVKFGEKELRLRKHKLVILKHVYTCPLDQKQGNVQRKLGFKGVCESVCVCVYISTVFMFVRGESLDTSIWRWLYFLLEWVWDLILFFFNVAEVVEACLSLLFWLLDPCS